MSLLHHCGGILAHSSLQNCFNSATLEGFRAWTACLRSCHSISIGFRSGLWLDHSRTFILFLLSHSEVDLLVCFESLSCCITQLRLSFRSQTDDRTFSFRIFLVESRIHGSINYGKSPRSWSSKAAPDHHTTTTVFYYWYDVLIVECCVSFTPDGTGPMSFKKFYFWLISPQNLIPKVLGVIKMFFGKCEMSLCVLFGQQWFSPCNSPMDAISAQSLSYCGIVNTDLNWGKWGLQFFRC